MAGTGDVGSRAKAEVVRIFGGIFRPFRAGPPEELRISGVKSKRTAIEGHLSSLFWEAMAAEPQLMVEVGVRGGQSTSVLVPAARVSNSWLLSVDIEPTTHESSYDRWMFIQRKSQELGNNFEEFCSEKSLPRKIDFLFLDSSHLYDETVEELLTWKNHLHERATLVFHDTNMSPVYRRTDGGLGAGWQNHQGVVRALEDVLGVTIDPGRRFVGFQDPWVVRHEPLSSGFTVLRRVGEIELK